MRFSGETALITGGGSGIGRAIAIGLASEGAKVVAADRFADRAGETASIIREAGGTAIGVVIDVTSEELVTSGFAVAQRELGPVTILVNNAGLSVGGSVVEMSASEWDLNFEVVIRGAFLCSRAALPNMIEAGNGVILNIASVNGMLGIGEEGYSAAKAGLINLTQNLAMRHGPQGIRANVISPGTIITPIWSERLKEEPDVFDGLAAWYPLGRVGTIEDVAAAALFLCSKDAAWITGVNLPVDGGLTAGNFRMITDLSG